MFTRKQNVNLKRVTQSYRTAYVGTSVNDNKVVEGLLIKCLTYKDLQELFGAVNL